MLWCSLASTCCICIDTKAPTTSTPAPKTTPTHAAIRPPKATPKAIPTICARAPPACDSPLPCIRSLPLNTSGTAADFTARATRVTACAAISARIRPTVAAVLPSEESEPSGMSTTIAITATIAATIRFAHHITRRRGNRSMNTPMNGEIKRVRDVQPQDDLQQVVGRGHVRDVETLLTAETDRLADRPLHHALTGLGEELHAEQHGEGPRRERREELVEEPAEALEGFAQPRVGVAQRGAEADRDGDHRPALRRRQRAAPDRKHTDPRQHQHDDRHARDQAHPVHRRADAEPARREPARHDQQERKQGDHQQVVRPVGQRARMVGHLHTLGLGGRLRLVDDLGRRRPETVGGQHVDAGTDLDALAVGPSPAGTARPSRPAARWPASPDRRPGTPARCTDRRSSP